MKHQSLHFVFSHQLFIKSSGKYGKMPSPIFSSGSLVTLFLTIGFSYARSGSLVDGMSFPTPTGVSTTYASTTYNASAASTTLANDDFSDEKLAFLWNQVGPVAIGPVTETAEPTPEPSTYGNPASGGFHPFIPSYETNLSTASLPVDFAWGVASSAFQIEVSSGRRVWQLLSISDPQQGAANAEGKGPSIWDFLSHRVVNQVADNSTADVAASHYYLYKQDFARLKNLGVPAFSFSISWPRIFPFGKGPINEDGVAHYDSVFAELVKQDFKIAPVLFHWDTPLALFNEYGAWSDRQIVDDFFNYATFIIQRYDHLVDEWFVSTVLLVAFLFMFDIEHTRLSIENPAKLQQLTLLQDDQRTTILQLAVRFLPIRHIPSAVQQCHPRRESPLHLRTPHASRPCQSRKMVS